MRIWYAIAVFLFFSLGLNSPEKKIRISPSREGWKETVDSAIRLIKATDSVDYRILIDNCDEINFMLGTISTTIPPHVIVINTEDMAKNSVNNIASLLVHESYHLHLYNNKTGMDPIDEELECYKREYDFLTKLPTVEDWLFIHVVKQIIHYQMLGANREK
jgi:hypothetical protein